MKINARPRTLKYGSPDGEYNDPVYRAHKQFCYNHEQYYTYAEYVALRDSINAARADRFTITKAKMLANADLVPRSKPEAYKNSIAQREFASKFKAKCEELGLYKKVVV